MHQTIEGKWQSRSSVRGLALLVSALLACAGVLLACTRNLPENFDCVEKGVLYRSGQPDAEALEQIINDFGIRTIVNLRSEGRIRKDRHGLEEIRFARDHGINLIILPYNDPGPEVQAERFLSIMDDPANYPVLVHCARGEERSGVMVAVYRIAHDGWSLERTLEEMKAYGFELSKKPEMTRFVLEYAKS